MSDQIAGAGAPAAPQSAIGCQGKQYGIYCLDPDTGLILNEDFYNVPGVDCARDVIGWEPMGTFHVESGAEFHCIVNKLAETPDRISFDPSVFVLNVNSMVPGNVCFNPTGLERNAAALKYKELITRECLGGDSDRAEGLFSYLDGKSPQDEADMLTPKNIGLMGVASTIAGIGFALGMAIVAGAGKLFGFSVTKGMHRAKDLFGKRGAPKAEGPKAGEAGNGDGPKGKGDDDSPPPAGGKPGGEAAPKSAPAADSVPAGAEPSEFSSLPDDGDSDVNPFPVYEADYELLPDSDFIYDDAEPVPILDDLVGAEPVPSYSSDPFRVSLPEPSPEAVRAVRDVGIGATIIMGLALFAEGVLNFAGAAMGLFIIVPPPGSQYGPSGSPTMA